MKKNKKKNKKPFILFITLSLILVIGVYIYNTYNKIEVKTSDYKTEKTLSTTREQTVDNAEENSKKVSNIIEEVTHSVVRNI